MLVTLKDYELATLEDNLHNRLDELSDAIYAIEEQIEELYSEYSWYDSQTNDYILTGNAAHYEDNLQGELAGLDEDVLRTRAQLKDVLRLRKELSRGYKLNSRMY